MNCAVLSESGDGITSTCRNLEHLNIGVDMQHQQARCFSMQLQQACVTALTNLLQMVSLRSLSLTLPFSDLAAVPLSALENLTRIRLLGTRDHSHVSRFLVRFFPHAMSLQHLEVYVAGPIREIIHVLCDHCKTLETLCFENSQREFGRDIRTAQCLFRKLANRDDDENLRRLPNLRLLQFGDCPEGIECWMHQLWFMALFIGRPHLHLQVGAYMVHGTGLFRGRTPGRDGRNPVIDRIWWKPVMNIQG